MVSQAEKEDYEQEYSRLEGLKAGLDPATASYYDEMLSIYYDQWEVLKSIESLTDDALAVAEQELSTAQQNLDAAIDSIKSIDGTIFDLTSGSLAAVQSKEGYQLEYDRLLAAAKSEMTPESLSEFTQFATKDYLDAMLAYGFDQQVMNDMLLDDFRDLKQSYVTEKDLLEEIVANTKATVDELKANADEISGSVDDLAGDVSKEDTLKLLLDNFILSLKGAIDAIPDPVDPVIETQTKAQEQLSLSKSSTGDFKSSDLSYWAQQVSGAGDSNQLLSMLSNSSIAANTKEAQIGSGKLYVQTNPRNSNETYAQYVDQGEEFKDQMEAFMTKGLAIGSSSEFKTMGELLFNSGKTVEDHLIAIAEMTGLGWNKIISDYQQYFYQGAFDRQSHYEYPTPYGKHGFDFVQKDGLYQVKMFSQGGLGIPRPGVVNTFAETEDEWAVPSYKSPYHENFIRSVGIDRILGSSIGSDDAKQIISLLKELLVKKEQPVYIKTDTTLTLDAAVVARSTNEQVRKNPRAYRSIANGAN